MKNNNKAFTLVELLIVIAIIGLLAALALPAVTGALARAQLTGIVSNARQIHVAAQQMALDVITGASTVGWPGDNNTPTTGSAKVYLEQLKNGGYLAEAEIIKLVSGPGFPQAANWSGLAATNIQFRIGNVTAGEDGTVMWLWTKNFNNPADPIASTSLNANVGPGKAGFVVLRKGGDGGVYQERILSKTEDEKKQIMGKMPSSTTKVLTDG